MRKATLQTARAAKVRAVQLLDGLPGLMGVGVCRRAGGGYGLKVNLECGARRTSRMKVPRAIKGVPVSVAVIGKLKPR